MHTRVRIRTHKSRVSLETRTQLAIDRSRKNAYKLNIHSCVLRRSSRPHLCCCSSDIPDEKVGPRVSSTPASDCTTCATNLNGHTRAHPQEENGQHHHPLDDDHSFLAQHPEVSHTTTYAHPYQFEFKLSASRATN